MQLALSPPPAGRTRWTTCLLGKEVGITVGAVSGLYLNPPERAVVLSIDEKTSIQALEHTQPPLPLRSGCAECHTHDYKRHGVIDLYAALELSTGRVTHSLRE